MMTSWILMYKGMLIISYQIADIPPPNLMKQGNGATPFYVNIKIIIPLVVFLVGLFISVGLSIICLKRSKLLLIVMITTSLYFYLGQNEASAKEQLDNQQNAEVQRERYYATIHKVTLQPGEKIPGK